MRLYLEKPKYFMEQDGCLVETKAYKITILFLSEWIKSKEFI